MQLSGQDASFLYLETPGAHLHLTGLYVYSQASTEPLLTFDDIRRLIADALHGVRELRQKLVRPPLDIDYPYWVDDPDFCLEQHVLRCSGPTLKSRRALFNKVADIHGEPLDLNRPPWEMQVIEKLGRIPGFPAHCFAIVMKYHHAAIDGASGAQLVDRLHGVCAAAPAQEEEPSPQPGRVEVLSRALINNTGNAMSLAKYLLEAAPAVGRSLLGKLLAPGTSAAAVPDSRFNGPVSSRRIMHVETLPLARLRDARKQVPGATVNDVLLALCGGALRCWLQERDELPEASLVAMVPVNTRAEDESDLGGNRLSMMFLPIGSHIADPLERLVAIQQASHKAKSSESAIDQRLVSAISSHVPALPLALMARLMTGLELGYRSLRLCNCTITNVPASHGELRLGPARLIYTAGNGPLIDGMGLIISLFSYEGEVNICITSCPEMLPDPEVLAREFSRQLNQLLAA
jgi:WS/DGAT/MGAT family acyltransferase